MSDFSCWLWYHPPPLFPPSSCTSAVVQFPLRSPCLALLASFAATLRICFLNLIFLSQTRPLFILQLRCCPSTFWFGFPLPPWILLDSSSFAVVSRLRPHFLPLVFAFTVVTQRSACPSSPCHAFASHTVLALQGNFFLLQLLFNSDVNFLQDSNSYVEPCY